MKISTFTTLVIFFGLISKPAYSNTVPIMRISSENTSIHIQTRAIKRFAYELKQKLSGKVDVRFYPKAQLFRDKNVIQAMVEGKLEMAVPGTWHITRYEPNVGIFLLPVFYGRPGTDNYKLLDSPVGKELDKRIESNTKTKVLGRWIDLGHAHIFSLNKKIKNHGDIAGMHIRVAGGIGNELRIKALGGLPLSIPWPDLPNYMKAGRIDAVLTSYETIKSAKLWEKGIKYAYEDREYFPQYIPLIRTSFWMKLSKQTQQILKSTWDKYVDISREEAAAAQATAKQTFLEQGLEIVVPDAGAIFNSRQKILAKQKAFIKRMGIDPIFASKFIEKLN